MINFDRLPQDNPFALPTPGLYRAKVVEAVMKPPKNDPTKPDYLNLKLALFDHEGKNSGNVYDIIAESDSSVVQYKTARFVRACGIPLTGSIELKDLAKLVNGKEIAVDIRHSRPRQGEDATNFTPKAEVDMFSRAAYYLKDEYQEQWNLINGETPTDFGLMNENVGDAENAPFNASDGNAPVGQPGTPEY